MVTSSAWHPSFASYWRCIETTCRVGLPQRNEKPAPDSTRVLLLETLEWDYAAYRRRQEVTKMPRPPSNDQTMKVAGSGMAVSETLSIPGPLFTLLSEVS